MSVSKIGPYEIKKTLRHDRQYALFAAYDPRVREDVILKLWRREHVTTDFVARVKQEAGVINGLRHPAIVPIWGFGDMGGNPYVATLEMTGGTLADRLKQGRIPGEEVARIFTRLMQAVEVLHEHNIVHGTIQPQHIFFDANGEAYLAWGANQLHDVDYTSPEQTQGRPATPASDLFSLGVVLLSLLTGKTLDTVSADELPEQYVPLLERALYEKPEGRFASAREMLVAFQNSGKAAPPAAAPPPPASSDFDFEDWGVAGTVAASGAAAALTGFDDDDPFAAWGLDETTPSTSPVSPSPAALTPDDDPFAAFDNYQPSPPPPPQPRSQASVNKGQSPDADAELMALFSQMDEEEDEVPAEPDEAKAAGRRAPQPPPQRQFVYDPGEPTDEPFPNWLEEEMASPSAETLLPTLDQFLTPTQNAAASSGATTGSKGETRPRKSSLDPRTRRILTLIVGVTLLLACLIPAIALLPTLLTPEETITFHPTALPVATNTVTPDPNAPTITPTPTPSIRINNPQPDIRAELGTAVQLNITITDPVGLRAVSILANGQVIGTHNLNGENEITIEQEWFPVQAGRIQLSVVATNRNNTDFSSDTVVFRVVDQALIDLNAPIWARVESNVTAIRGLELLSPIEPNLVSRTELSQRYREDFFAYYSREEADRDVRVFYAFDFINLDYDLYRRYLQYLGDNITGYYDPATEEFVVVNRGDVITPLGQLIYAHEFMHVLQDQHFQLDILTETNLTTDQNLALRGLAEGEAELIQSLYLEGNYFTAEEQVELFNESNIGTTQDTSGRNLPRVLVDAFYYPYTIGGEFVDYLYQRGGWAAIDQAWANPPVSSEQIYHPERYVAGDVPQIVSVVPLTDTLGTDWQLVRQETAGEFFIRQHLLIYLGETEAEAASTGWGGDQFAVYWNEATSQAALLFRIVWDTEGDAAEFAAAYDLFNTTARRTTLGQQPDGGFCWQASDVVCLYAQGAETVIVRAPTLEMVGRIAAAGLTGSQ